MLKNNCIVYSIIKKCINFGHLLNDTGNLLLFCIVKNLKEVISNLINKKIDDDFQKSVLINDILQKEVEANLFFAKIKKEFEPYIEELKEIA